MPRLSVIIPTHKRASILEQCLRHLAQQTIADEIEVIVVDDADDMETKKVVTLMQAPHRQGFTEKPMACMLVSVEPCQQGAARNAGVSVARGERVLFIGDDILLEPDACERHAHCTRLAQADRHGTTSHLPFAILGYSTWDPLCEITPAMRWLEKSGWQFGYPSLQRELAHSLDSIVPVEIQHRYSYSSHISLPLVLAKRHLFRTDVHLYGWEDMEWGMRLRDAGVRLVYDPDARALHHHHMTLKDSLRRMEILGRSAVEITTKVPEFDRVPRGWKLFAYRVLSHLPTLGGKHRKAFLRGMES